jgi:hypothetical protein
MTPIEAVRHDAASLYHFVESISKDCDCGDHPSYVKSSTDFFSYIRELSSAIKKFLKDFVENLDPALATSNPVDFNNQAQVIRNLRFNLFEFHKLIKPALDADTLHGPYPLLDALTLRLRQIPGFESAEFVLIHTSDLNYYQIGASNVRQLADLVAALIPGAPVFPKHLGVVGIPYSQSAGLFLNVALAHEMGHFVFQERLLRAQLSHVATQAVLACAGSGNALGLNLAWCRDRVLGWCEEIYCDLFALWLIGPAFSFSFIELFAYSRVAPPLSKSANTQVSIASEVKFYPSHPAPALRLREHVVFMREASLDWWKEIEQGSSHYLDLLKDASTLDNNLFTFSDQKGGNLEKIALDAFFKVVDKVHETVRSTFTNVPTGVTEFVRDRQSIQDYLSYGLVPSRLVTDLGIIIPPTVSLITSSYIFYLESLDLLINRVDGAENNCLECRSHWSGAIEMWTTKALEDVNI